jgi:hypothetical protein
MVMELSSYKELQKQHCIDPFVCALEVHGRDLQFWQSRLGGLVVGQAQLRARALCDAVASALGLQPGAVAFMGVSKTGGRAGGPRCLFEFNVTIHTNTDLRKLESAVQAGRGGGAAFDAALAAVPGWPVVPVTCRALSCKTQLRLLHVQMEGVLRFWRQFGKDIPAWAQAAARVFAFAPSSATVERLFSILKASFSNMQLDALVDYVSLCVKLQYHKREVVA